MSEKGALWDIDRIWAKVQIGEGTASWGREQTKVIIDKQIDSYRTALKKKIEAEIYFHSNDAKKKLLKLIDSTTI